MPPLDSVRGTSMMRWLLEPRKRSEISCSSSTKRPSTSTSTKREQLVRDLAAGMGAVGVQLLPGEAGKGPDGLARQPFAHAAQEGQQPALIFGLERLAAEERETVDVGGREHLQQSLLRFGGKGLTVVKRPGLRLEAVFAAVGAAGDEKRHADALAVGDVCSF